MRRRTRESGWAAACLLGSAGAEYGQIVLAGREGVSVLSADDGRVLARLPASAVPGGMTPGCVAARGRWILVADEQGKRLVRLKVEATR